MTPIVSVHLFYCYRGNVSCVAYTVIQPTPLPIFTRGRNLVLFLRLATISNHLLDYHKIKNSE